MLDSVHFLGVLMVFIVRLFNIHKANFYIVTIAIVVVMFLIFCCIITVFCANWMISLRGVKYLKYELGKIVLK